MAEIARYACTSLPGLNSANKLKPDATGYYKCILGGFNMSNHSGVNYPLLPSVKALFGEGGIVRRRLDAGLCKGEYGHPKLDGMALNDILKRLAFIDPLLTSHHIKSIELQNQKDTNGKELVLAVGMVKPSGPYGQYLAEQLNNPEENVAFSIRSFTRDIVHNGLAAKQVVDAMTYDFVTEPGISKATKFNTVSLEELHETILFTDRDLTNAIATSSVAGLEATSDTLTMVKTALGWNQVRVTHLSALNW